MLHIMAPCTTVPFLLGRCRGVLRAAASLIKLFSLLPQGIVMVHGTATSYLGQ
jgi:hypothetical protein